MPATGSAAVKVAPKFARVQRVDLDKVIVDPDYQRELKAPVVNKIVRKFNADLCVPLVVNDRGGDVYAVVDGQHRLFALRTLHVRSHHCYVLNVDRAEEARLFVAYQLERMSISIPDRHRALVTAGDETAVRIDAIAKSMGLRIDVGKGEMLGVVHAVAALYAVYSHGVIRGDAEEHLRKVLRVLKEAWGYSPLAYAAPFMRGVSVFIFTYPHITTATLSERLARHDARRALTAIREACGMHSAGSAKSAGLVVVDLYNRNMRAGRLDPSEILLGSSRISSTKTAVTRVDTRDRFSGGRKRKIEGGDS